MGEDRKLAPRRTGPWTIIKKLPNGVNFQIENHRNEAKIVHHGRLSPVVSNELPSADIVPVARHSERDEDTLPCSNDFSSNNSLSSDSDSSYSASEDSDVDADSNIQDNN